jgi:tRNA modification GTPase
MQTVAAISTPPAPGALGVIRISGLNALSIADGVFRAESKQMLCSSPGYKAHFGRVYDGQTLLDECVALVFRAPHSYTGEDVAELSCHGGLFVLRRVLQAVFAAGAVAAGPGEFTKRAFLNGKTDLTAAESVMALISASGALAASAAIAAKSGATAKRVSKIVCILKETAARLAVFADFPEDDIAGFEPADIKSALSKVLDELLKMLSEFNAGQAIAGGIQTVIAGKPNAGKSTLMNLLARCEKSIVTPVAGTTRDIIEETVLLGGITLRLSDTAGLRETENEIEKIGTERAIKKLETSQLVFAVLDGSRPIESDDYTLFERLCGKKAIAVINKADQPQFFCEKDLPSDLFASVVKICAKQETALEVLQSAVETVFAFDKIDTSAGLLANERQFSCALRAKNAVFEAIRAMEDGFTLDCADACVCDALSALLELTGESVASAVADEVFERFCVGK